MSAITNIASNSTAAGPLLFTRSPEGPAALTALDRDQLRLQKQLNSILKSIKSPAVEEAFECVFSGLSRLCDILRIVEINVSEGGPLPVTLAAFALVDSESKSLVRYIETRISKSKSIKGPARDALDATSFALRHELKRVFGHDLAGLDASRPAAQMRADVMRAHGLLTNCFQQSIITLARLFNPSLGGELLFDDYRVRLKESAVLLRELSSLARLARRAEESRDAEASRLLIQELKDFCHGTIHYLMYKDRDEFEDIAGEVMSSHGSKRHRFILHCFATYLDALINQVRMRAVLNDQQPGLSEPKLAKKSRGGRR